MKGGRRGAFAAEAAEAHDTVLYTSEGVLTVHLLQTETRKVKPARGSHCPWIKPRPAAPQAPRLAGSPPASAGAPVAPMLASLGPSSVCRSSWSWAFALAPPSAWILGSSALLMAGSLASLWPPTQCHLDSPWPAAGPWPPLALLRLLPVCPLRSSSCLSPSRPTARSSLTTGAFSGPFTPPAEAWNRAWCEADSQQIPVE